MRKFIRKLTCLVLAVLIPLSSSAYYKDTKGFEWSSRDDNGDEWHAYAYNLEWNFKDYTLTVRKRPDHLVDNGNYWYKDEDGTYGNSYKNEMLDYYGRCTVLGWSDDGLLIAEVVGWVMFAIEVGLFIVTTAISVATTPKPVLKYYPSTKKFVYDGGLILRNPFSMKPGQYMTERTGEWIITPAYHSISAKGLTALGANIAKWYVPYVAMAGLGTAAVYTGLYVEESRIPRILIEDQNEDGAVAGGGGSIYGDTNGGYFLHFYKSPWSLMGYADEIKKVVIEEGVTVGTLAFAQLPNLRVVHAKKGSILKPLSFWECNSLSYVFIDDNFKQSAPFACSTPRKTTYVVNGEVEEILDVVFSYGLSPWVAPSMPYWDLGGIYAKSFNNRRIEPEALGEKYRNALIENKDYAIPFGIKTKKEKYKISRLRNADISVKYEFKEGTENNALMPDERHNKSKTPNYIFYELNNAMITEKIYGEEKYREVENEELFIDSIGLISVKEGSYPNGESFKIPIYQKQPSLIMIEDEEIKNDLGLNEDENVSTEIYLDYGFHTVIDVTAYDDDTYRENDIPTGYVEEDLTGNDNLFKVHNLNANGKTVITTAAQQDAMQTGGWDEIVIYANADKNMPVYILNFTSPATKVKINGEDRYYIDGKLSERKYGEDITIKPKTTWTDEKGNLQYAKEGEIYYDEVNVAANWGVDWNYRIKTIMYSKKTNLESLSVDGQQLYPQFRKDIYEYDIYSDIDPNHWPRVNDSISNPWSTEVIRRNSGDKHEIVINNKITGDSSKYTIRLNSTVPKLSKLSVDGNPIDLTNGWLDYEINVDVLDTNTPIIYEPAENSKVIDYGWDLTEIAEGRITYIITVQTKTFDERTYKIVLFKDMPVEEERQIKYSIQSSGDLYVGRKYNVKVVPEDRTAITIGNGEHILKYGVNDFKITLRKGDIKEYVYETVKADYSYYDGSKMTRGTTPDSTTTVTLFGNIQSDKDWDTEYFDLTKKLVIYCGKHPINTKIPENSAETIELRDAAVLSNNFVGNCKNLKELHLYQQPWQIEEGVFWNPDKMTIRTHGIYVNNYKSFPVWKKIGQILPFEGEEVPEEENVETGIDEVGIDERVIIYSVYGKYLGVTERRNRKIVIPAWLGHGVFVAKGSKYVEKFVN